MGIHSADCVSTVRNWLACTLLQEHNCSCVIWTSKTFYALRKQLRFRFQWCETVALIGSCRQDNARTSTGVPKPQLELSSLFGQPTNATIVVFIAWRACLTYSYSIWRLLCKEVFPFCSKVYNRLHRTSVNQMLKNYGCFTLQSTRFQNAQLAAAVRYFEAYSST